MNLPSAPLTVHLMNRLSIPSVASCSRLFRSPWIVAGSGFWEGHKTRRCRRVIYPESYITKCATYTPTKCSMHVPCPVPAAASERKKNNLDGSKDFDLNVQARIWPLTLSCVPYSVDCEPRFMSQLVQRQLTFGLCLVHIRSRDPQNLGDLKDSQSTDSQLAFKDSQLRISRYRYEMSVLLHRVG